MPTANGYTVGDDFSFVVQSAAGQLVLPITEFKAKPVYEDLKTRPIGQKPVHDFIPDGWTGDFKLDRSDATVDSFFAQVEASYYAGNPYAPGYIQQTVRERNMAVSQWRYTKVALKLDDAGTYSGPKRVEQTVGFMASDKQQVS